MLLFAVIQIQLSYFRRICSYCFAIMKLKNVYLRINDVKGGD